MLRVRHSPIRFEVAEGVVLAGDAWGEPDAPPVVLLTGAGQTRHAWGQTGEALAAAGFRAIAVDHRGHGDSTWPTGDDAYGMEVFLEDTIHLCAQLQRPVVIGASLGGMAALIGIGHRAAIDARALVLVDVAPRLEFAGATRVLEFMSAHPDGFATLDEAADWIASYLPHRDRRPTTAGLQKVLRQHGDRWRWHWDPRFIEGLRRTILASPAGARAHIAEMHGRMFAAASALRIPTLLVRGAMSDVVSEAGAREFLTAVPHATYLDVTGAGHMVAGDRNDTFTDAIITFLTDLPPTTDADAP